MNIDLIRTLAKAKGVSSLTKLEEMLGLGNGTIGKWAKQSPSCDKLYLVANFLSVSLDYLYCGKEKSSPSELSEEEQECLSVFRELTRDDQMKFIGRMQETTERYTPEMKENA